jgi:nucleotidyltransferase substrate binding protein (TIGR01987 family)
MDTLIQRTIARFQKAVTSLQKALALTELPEHADRDAVLLRFELAAELMPKMLQRVLSEGGADVTLPKEAVRSARAAGLTDDANATVLLAAIDDRNRMVHDYSEEFASGLSVRVRTQYAPAFQDLLERIQSK